MLDERGKAACIDVSQLYKLFFLLSYEELFLKVKWKRVKSISKNKKVKISYMINGLFIMETLISIHI